MAKTDIENEEISTQNSPIYPKRFNIDVDTLLLNIKFHIPREQEQDVAVNQKTYKRRYNHPRVAMEPPPKPSYKPNI